MRNLREHLADEAKIVKHYIKDLSFENLQNISNQNFKKNELEFSNNISVIFQTYTEKTFSVLLKYACDCTIVKNREKCFILEIDYFGLFIINNIENYSQDNLTKIGGKLLFPLLKPVVEYVTKNGAPLTISLKDLDFNQLKKASF
jgi:preprotein translocase subunit SecB